MHSEHISNLHPGWVAVGWITGLAVASAVFLVLVGLGVIGPATRGSTLLIPAVVGLGFFAGGLVVGLRWSDAPILHGTAITFVSVLVWFLGELLAPVVVEPLDPAGDAGFVLGMILVQLVSAVAGGWTGRIMVRRGETPNLGG